MHERLQQAFQDGRLLKPDAKAVSVVDAVNAIAHLAGITPPNPTDRAAELADQIGPAEHLMVLIVPGLSDAAVLSLPDDALLKRYRRRKLRNVVPTGQASLITTLATGLWPAQHGVFGRYAYLSERQRFVDVLNFTDTQTGEDLKAAGVVPTKVFREMPLWVDAQAEPVTYVTDAYRESAWAAYLSGYRTLRRCDGLVDAVEQHVERADESEGPTIGLAVLDPVTSVEALNEELVRTQQTRGERDLKIVLIGGGAAVETHVLADVPQRLTEAGCLAGLAGEPRLPMVFDDAAADRATDPADRQAVFGEGFVVVRAAEAVAAKWFGPESLTPFAEKRLPDWIAVSIDAVSVKMAGADDGARTHGGLAPQEAVIPLVVV